MAPPFRTVLCPTDLSPVGDAAVEVACALTAKEGTLHLLHVCEPAYVASPVGTTVAVPRFPSPQEVEALERKARQHLERLAQRAAAPAGVATQLHVVHDADAAAVVARTATALGADAVVLGTHGRTGLGRLLMGSVATDVLRAAKTQVIVVRPAR